MSIYKKILSLAFFILILPSVSPIIVDRAIAQTQQSEQAEKQAIIDIYHIWALGIERKDINQELFNYAPEYIHFENGKIANLKQIRQSEQQYYLFMHQANMNYHIEEIKISGDTATVRSTGYLNVVVINPKNPQISVPVSGVFQYQHTWKREGNRWLVTQGQTLKQNITKGKIQNNFPQTNIPLYPDYLPPVTSPVAPR